MYRSFHKLPEPISLEDEQEIVRTGNKSKLVEHNLRWILSTADSVGNGLDYDSLQDLRSYAVESTFEDAERFEERGVKFISYLNKFLSKRLGSYRSKMFDSNGREVIPLEGAYPLRLNHTPSISDSHLNEEGVKGEKWEDMVIDKVVESTDQSTIDKERDFFINSALDNLSPREKNILTSYIFDGRTLIEIGEEHGLRKGRAREIKERALAKLRYFNHTNMVPLEQFV